MILTLENKLSVNPGLYIATSLSISDHWIESIWFYVLNVRMISYALSFPL
jgi:hypothetical protein